jgi:hypothetical protein
MSEMPLQPSCGPDPGGFFVERQEMRRAVPSGISRSNCLFHMPAARLNFSSILIGLLASVPVLATF